MATYYINADTGNNGNDGSEESPWATLAHAYDNTIANDTIVCQDSVATYAYVTDTLADRTIQGESEDASGAIFDGAGAGLLGWTCSGTRIFSKLTIQNIIFGPTRSGVFFLSTATSASLVINQCIFKDIAFTGGSTSYHTGVVSMYSGNLNTIALSNCAFYNILGTAYSGIIYASYGCNNVTLTITGCSVYLNGTVVKIFYKGGGGGTAPSIVVTNSIFQHTASTAWATGLSASATYTCCNNITGAPAGTGNITSDPLFVDGDNGNLNLRPASPCIDTGTLI